MSVESKTTVHKLSDGSTWVCYEVDLGDGRVYKEQHGLFHLGKELSMWYYV